MIAGYIEFEIMNRGEAKRMDYKIGDTFLKLMNNAFYGKTIKNVYIR